MVTQIAGDVPVEPLPLHADATQLEIELQAYERSLAVTPCGTPELVPDWQETHAMSAYVPPPYLGQWVRTDLGVRALQGLGKNAPKREQVMRRLTRDAHTHQVLESLPCEVHLQVPLHRRCLPGCGPHTCATRDIQTTFVYRRQPFLFTPSVVPEELSPAPFPSGGGGSLFLSPSLSSPSFSLLLRGSPFSQFSTGGASENSTFGTQTLMAIGKFLDDAESRNRQGTRSSQETKRATNEGDAECKEEDPARDEPEEGENSVVTGEMHQDSGPRTLGRAKSQIHDEHSQTQVEKEVILIHAFRVLFNGFEEQWHSAVQQESVSSESEAEESQCEPITHAMKAQVPLNEDLENWVPDNTCAMIGFNQLWWHGSLEV